MAITQGQTIVASDFVGTASGAGDSGKVPKLDATGRIPAGFLKSGGTGANGALTISSGTTTIDLAGALVVVKNYTSISITETGKLAFINPHANGTMVFLMSVGAVTLTSSQAPMIGCSGLGSVAGSPSYGLITVTTQGSGGTGSGGGGGGGAGGLATKNYTVYLNTLALYPYIQKLFKIPIFTCGTAGGGGGNGYNNGGTPGAGGRGGGLLYIGCGGALNFTTASGISVNGANGANATAGSSAWNNGGGGGGGGGICIIRYNSLTSASGTITVAGGSGGTSSYNTTVSQGGCGGGGASFLNNGGAGQDTGNGGSGGAGYSLVEQNTDIA